MLSVFTSLAGALLSCLFYSVAVRGASSFSVDVRGHGVRLVDGPIAGGSVGVTTSDGLSYTTNITLGGLNLTVILDTGSSDLVLDLQGRQPILTNSTDIQITQAFGKGEVTGDIDFAELKLGDFTIDSQAFLNGVESADLGDTDGILGMSFNTDSTIQGQLAESLGEQAANKLGNTPMPALFAQDTDLPHLFDVQLARTSELESTAPGVFIIGGHDANFQNVSSAPQLPSVAPNHWSLVMDSMKVNGKAFTFNASRIAGVPSGKVVAALDTGFSLPPLPAPAVDAIYSSIPGAAFDAEGQQWFVPCDASTTLSFVFGGQEFFVHPLDLSYPIAGTINGAKRTACLNTYQYLTLDPDDFTGFDLILGDAFLRNVYASFNYGESSSSQAFVQMVTTTPDMTTALQEFKTERAATLSQLPPTVEPSAIVNRSVTNGSWKSSVFGASVITLAVPLFSLLCLLY